MKASIHELLQEYLQSIHSLSSSSSLSASEHVFQFVTSEEGSTTTPSMNTVAGFEVIEKVCHVIRGLSTFDDYRSEMSCAHDNSKLFLKQTMIIQQLIYWARNYLTYPAIAAAAISALRALVHTNEAVQILCQQHHILGLLIPCLKHEISKLTTNTTAVITTVEATPTTSNTSNTPTTSNKRRFN
jgi:hypothetical protein